MCGFITHLLLAHARNIKLRSYAYAASLNYIVTLIIMLNVEISI